MSRPDRRHLLAAVGQCRHASLPTESLSCFAPRSLVVARVASASRLSTRSQGNTVPDVTLTRQDLEDILAGACILGCGGGGPLVLGAQLLEDVIKLGVPPLRSPDDVDNAQMTAVSACAGSPTASAVGAFPYQVATSAFRALEKLTKKKLSCVLPGEVGAGNSFIPMLVAAQTGLPLLDAAGARRAMTTLQEATFAAAGLAPSPVSMADDQSNVSFSVATVPQADQVMRAVMSSGTFPNFAGVAFWLMDGKAMKSAAIHGTLSYTLALGKKLREARTGGGDAVEVVRVFLGGKILFRGRLAGTPVETSVSGFDVGRTTIASADGHTTCTVYNQNENLIAWRSDRSAPIGMGPDLLCWITADGQPFSNATPDVVKYATGKEIVLIGAPSVAASRASSIIGAYLALLLPMGYGGGYVPVEDLTS
jgi:DUF917 family protein